MSSCTRASSPAANRVIAPITAMVVTAALLRWNTGNSRATRNTPAVTIVAAWIRALTGVGPAIASGSQVWRGNWADLPIAPMNRLISAKVNSPSFSGSPPACTPPVAISMMSPMLNVPNIAHIVTTPTISPTSPNLVVRNAFCAANWLARSSHQNPISRNEQTPTSSQPTSSISRLFAMTSTSIDIVNRLSRKKK